MSLLVVEERPTDSTYLDTVARGITTGDGSSVRPAESSWHMVIRKLDGKTDLLVVGPWTSSGALTYGGGAEILWIKFSLGVYLSHLPMRRFRDSETVMPRASSRSFWLDGSAWEFPDFENVETFVDRLGREGVLAADPVVPAVLQGRYPDIAARTVRHHFLHTTGLTHSQIYQMERAQRAAALLEQGTSISEVTFSLGYYDQPHLTRSLKQWVGYTPGQLVRPAVTASAVLDEVPEPARGALIAGAAIEV